MSRMSLLCAIAAPLFGAVGGLFAADGLSLLTLEARRGAIDFERVKEARPGETNEEMAFRLSGQSREDAALAAQRVKRRMRTATTVLGAWCGLVVAFHLFGLNRKARRLEYAPHPGRCLSCGRCFAWCPRERAKRRPSQGEPR